MKLRFENVSFRPLKYLFECKIHRCGHECGYRYGYVHVALCLCVIACMRICIIQQRPTAIPAAQRSLSGSSRPIQWVGTAAVVDLNNMPLVI